MKQLRQRQVQAANDVAGSTESTESRGQNDDSLISKYFGEMSRLERPFTPAEELARAKKLKQYVREAALGLAELLLLAHVFTKTQAVGKRLPPGLTRKLRDGLSARRLADSGLSALRGAELTQALTAEASRLLATHDPAKLVAKCTPANLGQSKLMKRLVFFMNEEAAVKLAQFGTSEGVAAFHEFARRNLRLVVSIARRFNWYGPRVTLHELIQEGNIGLLKAVDRYDPKKGYRFSTYASWWIRHAISRYVADKARTIRYPVHTQEALLKLGRARKQLTAKLARPPEPEELAARLEMPLKKVVFLETLAAEPASLDARMSEEGNSTFGDQLADPSEDVESPEESALAVERVEVLQRVLPLLKPIEQEILRARFGFGDDEEQTLKEIGDRHRLSRERIRQIQEVALGKLRRLLAKQGIDR